MKIGIAPLDYYSQNDLDKCAAAGNEVKKQNLDFCGFTEVRTKQMKDGLKLGFRPTLKYVGKGESPQSLNPKKWKLVAWRYVAGNEGVEGITPDLGFVVARYQNVFAPRRMIKVVSTHFVPLTLHGKPRPNYQKRWEMWQSMWHTLERIIKSSIRAGITIFVVGDFNHYKADNDIIKSLHPKAKWIIRKGLSWAFGVEGDIKFSTVDLVHSFNTGSDHSAYWREVVLR